MAGPTRARVWMPFVVKALVLVIATAMAKRRRAEERRLRENMLRNVCCMSTEGKESDAGDIVEQKWDC